MRRNAMTWFLLIAGIVLGIALYVEISASAATVSPQSSNDYTGPFVTMKVPTFCASLPANTRYYTTTIPNGDTFMRSGEHNHGGNRIHCIFFGTGTSYGKWLIFNQSTGGWLITNENGLDVTYVNCGPPLRFPNPPNATTPNDCAESWSTGESDWRFTTGPNTGLPMIPSTTP